MVGTGSGKCFPPKCHILRVAQGEADQDTVHKLSAATHTAQNCEKAKAQAAVIRRGDFRQKILLTRWRNLHNVTQYSIRKEAQKKALS